MNKKSIRFKDLAKPLTVPQFWALAILAPLFFMYFTWRSSFNDWHTFLMAFSWYSIAGLTQGLGHAYIALQLDKFLTWEKSPKLRLVASILSIIIYSITAYVSVATILASFWFSKSLSGGFEVALVGVPIALKVSFLFAFIFGFISFFLHWQKAQIKTERLEKELANYRYQTLKSQVNPHFLFNSLNVLTELVHEDADLSEKYIHQLSQIYRYVLASTNHQTVSLSEELAFIQSYIFLLKIRFGDKIKFKIEAEAQPGESIVPVSIQMLLENAVKHNKVTKGNPLHISIKKENNQIVVRNNFQPKATAQDISGTGLANLEIQFQTLTDRPILVSTDEFFYTVSLPIIFNPKTNK